MDSVLKADPRFTNFVPRNAAEAVDRYVRCRKNGLKPMLIPECLIECAKGLDDRQMNLFEDWIINPNGSLDTLKLVPANSIREENKRIFDENCERLEKLTVGRLGPPPGPTPPLPMEVDDEKMEFTMVQPDSTSSEDQHSKIST